MSFLLKTSTTLLKSALVFESLAARSNKSSCVTKLLSLLKVSSSAVFSSSVWLGRLVERAALQWNGLRSLTKNWTEKHSELMQALKVYKAALFRGKQVPGHICAVIQGFVDVLQQVGSLAVQVSPKNVQRTQCTGSVTTDEGHS